MSDTLPEWLTICDDIDDGEHDEGLEQIMKACASRREVVARRNARRLMRELKKGDRVMLTNNVTPRFYEGMVGTVIKLQDNAARIQLDELPSGRGRTPAEGRSQKVLIPLLNIEKLDEDDIRAHKPKKKDIPDDEIGDDNDYEDDDEELEDDDED